jgi:serine/threonine-protein kinase
LSPEGAKTPELVRSFGFAARKAQVLRSRYAERVVDTGRLESGSPYRVSQLPSGPSLTEVLQVRGALPMAEAIDLMLTACDAVAEAHSVRLVYRNLSPSHLFLCRDVDGTRFLRLVDFGAPNVLETSARSGHELALPGKSAMTHSLPYTAPEQIRNPASVDHRADIWALGAILYELLAGRPAFEASTPLGLLAMIAADEPTALTRRRPAVPETLARTVHACLQKEPWTRPQTASDLITLLVPFATQHIRQAVSREPSASRAPSTLIGHPAPAGLAEWSHERRYSFPPRSALPKKLVPSSTLSRMEDRPNALRAALPGLRAQAALMDPYAVFVAEPPGSDLPAVVITRRDPPPTIAPFDHRSSRQTAVPRHSPVPKHGAVPGGARPTIAAIAAPRSAGHFGWLVIGCLATGIAAAALTTATIRGFDTNTVSAVTRFLQCRPRPSPCKPCAPRRKRQDQAHSGPPSPPRCQL